MSESKPAPTAAEASNPGELLQQARQQQGLSREQLAGKLHMRVDQLEALECLQQERWPEDVFTIAQVRRLADALGLDAEPLVASFRAQLKARQNNTSAAAHAVMQASVQRRAPVSNRDENRKDSHAKKRSSNPTADPSKGPQGQQRRRVAPSWLLPSAVVVGVLAVGGVGLHHLANNGLLKLPAASQPPAPSPKPEPKAAVAIPKELKLSISNNEAVWLAVRKLDNQQMLFEGLFQQTNPRSFPLGEGLQVLAGRPDLVMVGLGDQPPATLGPIVPIQWTTFKPAGAEVATP